MRIWKNENSIVLGISDQVKKNISEKKISEFQKRLPDLIKTKKIIQDEIYISRRASGGGTVFHDLENNLNYSLFFSTKENPELYPVKDSYKILLGLIQNSLNKQNIISNQDGKSDITILENSIVKKISGNAQFRKKDFLVQHGTLILNTKLFDKVVQNLSHPPEEPDYRKNRTHKDFLTSLPSEFEIKKFENDLFNEVKKYVKSNHEMNKDILFLKKVLKKAELLYLEKYANLEFIFSR